MKKYSIRKIKYIVNMWSKEKHKEYRKLKRSGYSDKELKEYFGDDIYESGLYNKKSNILRFLDYKINEIKIEPGETEYTLKKQKSITFKDKSDIIIEFNVKDHDYILILFYIFSNGIESYEIVFTTKNQYDEYIKEYNNILSIPGNHFSVDEQKLLSSIIEKETNYNEIIPLIKSISFILFDIHDSFNLFHVFSISETEKPMKIKLYRNIIKDSFANVDEEKIDNTYYYKIQK